MLEIAGLHAGYGPTEVLRGVSLNVAASEIVAVIGANGAGKTTLNNAISALLPARSGRIVFEGADIMHLPPPAIVERGLIHVPEGRRIFTNLSVRENLELGSYRRAKSRRRSNLARVFGVFPRLEARRSQLAGTLSGGEQQMLAIGRGLMAEPKLVILDEPSLGLSPLVVEELFALIRNLASERLAVMLVEQNAVQSLELAQRAYVIENGRVAMAGAAAELAADPQLQRTYLGM
jgi:branched-chain amino acid transport system ATP-binding protein